NARINNSPVDSSLVPPRDDTRDRLQCEDGTAHASVLSQQSRQRVGGSEDTAEQYLVLPLRLGRTAVAIQRHLRRVARLRLAVCVWKLRAVAVREHLLYASEPRRTTSAVGRDDAQHRRLREEWRSK